MSHYLIQRQVFDVTFDVQSKATELQDKISRLFNQQLMDEVQSLFAKIIPGDLILQLDHLIIDAGRIDYEDVDNNLVRLIVDALEVELKSIIDLKQTLSANSGNIDETVVKANYINVIEYYLLYGALPWWSKSLVLQDVSDIIAKLISDQATEFKSMLFQVGRYSFVQHRLAQQFNVDLIKKIIAVLEPANAVFIFKYHTEIVELQQQQNLVKAEAGHFGKVVWEFILRTLLTDVAGRFNRKMFVKSNIAQIAAYFNLSYQDLLQLLHEAGASDEIRKNHYELFDLVKELWIDDQQDFNDTVEMVRLIAPATDRAGILYKHLETVNYFLNYGSFPESDAPDDRRKINDLFMESIDKVPHVVKDVINAWQQFEDPGERITTMFDSPAIIKVIHLIQPANADFIVSYHQDISKVQQDHRLVNVEQAGFERTLWSLILNYLFTERGSEFNRKAFLQRNIRSIASHYNVRLQDLVTTLRLTAKTVMRSGLMNTFFTALNDISEHKAINFDDQGHDEHLFSAQGQVDKAGSGTRYRDILIYWLKHHKLPWWYSQSGKQPQDLFLELTTYSSQYIVVVLQFAGSSAKAQQLLIDTIPLNILLKAFNLLPGGDAAVRAYADLNMLLANSGILKEQQKVSLSKILLQVLFKSYHSFLFQNFNPTAFLELVLQQLEVWYGVESTFIYRRLAVGLSTNEQLKYLSDLFKQTVSFKKTAVFTGRSSVIMPVDMHQWLNQLWAGYLQSGVSGIYAEQWFNEALTGHLRETYPAALTDEELLQELLANKNNVVTRSALVMQKKLTEVLLSILTYYLSYNKLPVGLRLSAQQADALLQYIVGILYQKQKAQLQQLFGNSTNAIAKMHIHNLFSVAAGVTAGKVHQFLNAYLEQDLLQYVNTLSGTATDTSRRQSFLQLFKTLSKDNASGIGVLLERMMQQQSLVAYIAANYTNDEVYDLIAYKSYSWNVDTIRFLKDVSSFFTQVADSWVKEVLLASFRVFNISYLLGSNIRPDPVHYITTLFGNFHKYLGILTVEQLHELLKLTVDHSGATAAFYNLLPVLKNLLQNELSRRQGYVSNEVKLQKSNIINIQLPVTEQDLLEELTGNINEQMKPEQQPELPDGQSFSISNAGLIIMHPFFSTYFNLLGMLDKGIFIDIEHRRRAVHLLQYLVDSSTDKPEHQLLLNKILVGLPPEETVPDGIQLTEKEVAVSEQLFKAVANQWDKMKNTSVEGFRASFLQRDGTLTFNEGNWNLRVEPRGYDILLQTLPWGLSLIKNTWMNNMLTVEWEQA